VKASNRYLRRPAECFRHKTITRLMRGLVTTAHDEPARGQAVLLLDESSALPRLATTGPRFPFRVNATLSPMLGWRLCRTTCACLGNDQLTAGLV
jgi:hypothetical protein